MDVVTIRFGVISETIYANIYVLYYNENARVSVYILFMLMSGNNMHLCDTFTLYFTKYINYLKATWDRERERLGWYFSMLWQKAPSNRKRETCGFEKN